MSARTLRHAVAAVVTTAALAVTGTACGSGDDAPGGKGRTPAAETAAPSPTAGGVKTGEPTPDPEQAEKRAEGESEKDAAEEPPTVPKEELTPATGTFTGKQKEYLVDRVPRGTDPAAVLEAGQAACDRIARTVKVDRKAAVSALRSGEIAGAKDAVVHLCPKHKPLLEAAGLTG